MKKSCTLCGCSYDNVFAFKAGYVCEECLQVLKTDCQHDNHVRIRY